MNEPDFSAVDPNQLPPQLRRLVATIGLPETVKLLAVRGGTPLRIPSDPDRAGVLKRIISTEAVRALCQVFPGQLMELPVADKIMLQIRNKAITHARGNKSAAQLAIEYGLTRRQIINISNAPVDDRQTDLFED